MQFSVAARNSAWVESDNAAIRSFDNEVEPQLVRPVSVGASSKLGVHPEHARANQELAMFVMSEVNAPRCPSC